MIVPVSYMDSSTINITVPTNQHGSPFCHIPRTNKTCKNYRSPPVCGSRAAVALEFKIQGFVRCELVTRYRDRSYAGLCSFEGEDLGAYLISKGWAVAAPGAPFDYSVRERIARNLGFGVWGLSADVITRP